MATNTSINSSLHDDLIQAALMSNFECYAYIVLGVITIVLSLLCIVGIYKEKVLRRKNAYILISIMCVGYLIDAIGIIFKACQGLYINRAKVTRMRQVDCFFQWLFLIIGSFIVIDTTFVTAVDRFIAIFFPIFYRRHKEWWWIVVQISFIVCHVIISTCRVSLATSNEIIEVCSILTSMELECAISMLIELNIFVFATIMLYCFMIMWAKRSMKKMEKATAKEKRKNIKWKLMVTFSLIMAVYTMTMFMGNLCYTLAGNASTLQEAVVLYRLGQIGHLQGFLCLSVLLLRMEELRVTALRVIFPKYGKIGHLVDMTSTMPNMPTTTKTMLKRN